MSKTMVTKEDVAENMKDIIVRTEVDFGKPTTYVVARMKNGFTLRESTTCVDPANYDEEIGKKICLERIESKIWYLLGYALQEKLYKENNDELLKGLEKERAELVERLNKLNKKILKDGFVDEVGSVQATCLLEQHKAMEDYVKALDARINDLKGKY